MTRFIVADDGENEPTIWVEGGVVSVVRRVDLPPDARGVWDDLVAAVLAGQERAPVPRREAPSYGEAEFR